MLKQIEIDLVKNCIRRHQRFLLIHSKSDEIIRRVVDDTGLDIVTSKKEYVRAAEMAVEKELGIAKIPEEVIKELKKFCILINKNDLLSLVVQDKAQWPRGLKEFEIHERLLLHYLFCLSAGRWG